MSRHRGCNLLSSYVKSGKLYSPNFLLVYLICVDQHRQTCLTLTRSLTRYIIISVPVVSVWKRRLVYRGFGGEPSATLFPIATVFLILFIHLRLLCSTRRYRFCSYMFGRQYQTAVNSMGSFKISFDKPRHLHGTKNLPVSR